MWITPKNPGNTGRSDVNKKIFRVLRYAAGGCREGLSDSQQLFSYFDHVPGSHGDQQVIGLAIFQKEIFDLVEGGEIVAGRAPGQEFFLQIQGGNAHGVFFPGCVNIRQDDLICQGQGFGKVV